MLKYVAMNEEKNRKNRKKAFILSSIYLLFCMFYNSLMNKDNERSFSYVKNPYYDQEDNNEYAFYNGKSIYIVNGLMFKSDNFDEDGIYILDNRHILNSNLQIKNSYLIRDDDEIYNILAILIEYENEFPSRWDRSIDGMYAEWYLHNLFYDMCILKDRSCNVDLDIKDSFFFEDILIKKLFLK